MPKREVVKSVLAFFTLILFWFLGNGLSHFVALPAALLGLLLLFIGLVFLGRVPKSLEQVSQFFLRHLSFFFIPPLLAAWFYAEQLGNNLWLFLFAIVLSTLVSLCITSWLGKRFFKPSKNSDFQDDQE
ncbi:CidA/LrgA family protein [uncultured Paraglaciecola sp.]|uniref:CidA/LrgA family protein n=1 Tax=uncultured Paraglaciecola sp. TaxID=1765024 RepID=UPI0030D9AD0D|tara:strand:+ start:70817 stop:71203 length:387 start_codon:yes stop_codon:yes gene_type:complete